MLGQQLLRDSASSSHGRVAAAGVVHHAWLRWRWSVSEVTGMEAKRRWGVQVT